MRAMIGKAIEVAVKAHAGVFRIGGEPYINHPYRVANAVMGEGDEVVQVAILHDVVEDTDITLADLKEMGFSEAVVEAVDSVSRRDGEIYADFIVRASQNPMGRLVKIADVKDNLSTLDEMPAERAKFSRKRYTKALAVLEEDNHGN